MVALKSFEERVSVIWALIWLQNKAFLFTWNFIPSFHWDQGRHPTLPVKCRWKEGSIFGSSVRGLPARGRHGGTKGCSSKSHQALCSFYLPDNTEQTNSEGNYSNKDSTECQWSHKIMYMHQLFNAVSPLCLALLVFPDNEACDKSPFPQSAFVFVLISFFWIPHVRSYRICLSLTYFT